MLQVLAVRLLSHVIFGLLSTGTDWKYKLQLVPEPVPLSQIQTEAAASSIAGESLSLKPAALSGALGGAIPGTLTILIKGTMTRGKDPVSYANAIPFRWKLSGDDYLDLIISTYGSHTGRPYFRTNIGGSKSEVSGPDTAYPLGIEVEFALAIVIDGGTVEGFYNGVSAWVPAFPAFLICWQSRQRSSRPRPVQRFASCTSGQRRCLLR